jgi:hypothetical protein
MLAGQGRVCRRYAVAISTVTGGTYRVNDLLALYRVSLAMPSAHALPARVAAATANSIIRFMIAPCEEFLNICKSGNFKPVILYQLKSTLLLCRFLKTPLFIPPSTI